MRNVVNCNDFIAISNASQTQINLILMKLNSIYTIELCLIRQAFLAFNRLLNGV